MSACDLLFWGRLWYVVADALTLAPVSLPYAAVWREAVLPEYTQALS
jgi:hypothetical protein